MRPRKPNRSLRWPTLIFFLSALFGLFLDSFPIGIPLAFALGSGANSSSSQTELPFRYFIPALRRLNVEEILGPLTSSGVSYRPLDGDLHDQGHSFPVIPAHPWALRFPEDYLVSLTNDGDWGMVEIVRIPDAHQDLWFVLDSQHDGTQFVGLSDDPRAKEIASSFPAPHYSAHLEVTRQLRENRIFISASYQRIDGRKIAFEFEVDSTSHPHSPFQRNGHAMNHSQQRTLALLDLFEFRFAKSPVHFQNSQVSPQKFLGFPISGMLTQTVGGLQSETTVQTPEKIQVQTLEGVQLSRSLKTELIEGKLVLLENTPLSQTQYQFENHKGFQELRAIVVRPTKSESQGTDPLFEMRFNPSLPDLRAFPSGLEWTGKVSFRVQNQRPFGFGSIRISKRTPESEVEIQWMPEYPEWAEQRPLLSTLKWDSHRKSVTARHQLLSQNAARLPESRDSQQIRFLPDQEQVPFLVGVDFKWQKRPHRLSRLTCLRKNSGALEQVLGGGTWANGESASDSADISSVQGLWKRTNLEKGPLFAQTITLPLTPLIQTKKDPSAKASTVKLSSIQEVRLEWNPADLPSPFKTGKPLVWLQGFSLEPGPLHHRTGITPTGLSWDTQILEAGSGFVRVRIQIDHSAGSVPDRIQNLEEYIAFTRTQLGIALFPQGAPEWSSHESRYAFQTPFRILAEPELPFGFPKVSEGNSNSIHLWKSFEWSLHTENERNPGRYLRQIRLQSGQIPGHPFYSNAGEWTRPTQGRIKTQSWMIETQRIGSNAILQSSIEGENPITTQND